MSTENVDKMNTKLDAIDVWINNPSLNEGHEANRAGDSNDSLWDQQLGNTESQFSTFDYLLEKYLQKGMISEEEHKALIERRNSIRKKFDDQAQKIRSMFTGNN